MRLRGGHIAAAAAVASAGGALIWVARRKGSGPALPLTYSQHPKGRHGPIWGNARPPGLPASARVCGAAGSADPFIEHHAGRAGLGDQFVTWCKSLAQTESGRQMGRPANNFDARPKGQRGGKPLITAFDGYQWNAPAGWHATHMAALGIPGVVVPGGRAWRPWQDTANRSIARPIEMYRQIWAFVLANGGTALDAGRAARLWHAVSGTGKGFLRNGSTTSWSRAWAQVPGHLVSRIDHHHRGVLGGLSSPDPDAQADPRLAAQFMTIGAIAGWGRAFNLCPPELRAFCQE